MKIKTQTILLIIFLALLPFGYLNYRNYQASIQMKKLKLELNSNTFKIPLNEIIGFQYNYPNITNTTLPISGVLARYYFVNSKFEKAIALLHQGKGANPYLKFNENILSEIYLAIKEIDSAYFYSKIAFEAVPNNPANFGHYSKALIYKKKYRDIKSAFERVKDNYDINIWKQYLAILSSNKDSMSFEDLEQLSQTAIKKFPKDESIKLLTRSFIVGEENVKLAAALSAQADSLMDSGKHKEAAKLYMKAFEIDSEEYSFLQNAVISDYNGGNYEKSLSGLALLLEKFDIKTGKPEMIYGMNLVKLNRMAEACEYFTKAVFKNYPDAIKVKSKYCVD